MLISALGLIFPSPVQIIRADGDPIFVGAGDIVDCNNTTGAEQTAKLIDTIPGLVFAAGDLVYQAGTADNYTKCFNNIWGRFKDRLRPVPGNHDYYQGDIKGYRAYFGGIIGTNRNAYYSFNYGAWHIIMLNSNAVNGLQEEELAWLKADLAANPTACKLAVAHHPVFSSGNGGVSAYTRAYFKALYAAGTSVLISGSTHGYERFAPQDLYGNKQPTRGIRQFIVGTGGAGLNPFNATWHNSENLASSAWGVLKLTLHASSYSWQFIPVAGGKFTDSGDASCSTLPVATVTPAK